MAEAAERGAGRRTTGRFWAIVLAGGSGTRVRHLTRDSSGARVPKQYCAFDGEHTMVAWALRRAARQVPRSRIVAVVAEEHRRWWLDEFQDLPPKNVLVQPVNRGTAAGVLLPLMEILRRDRDATVALFPSDHHVDDEDALASSVRLVASAVRESGRVALLGAKPHGIDTECGWILPAEPKGTLRPVSAFVEKPEAGSASLLLQKGALLNTFILVGSARTLLHLFAATTPGLLGSFSARRTRLSQPGVLRDLYREIPERDFSRHILEKSQDDLAVAQLPDCGWSDLGSPWRLNDYLNRLGSASRSA